MNRNSFRSLCCITFLFLASVCLAKSPNDVAVTSHPLASEAAFETYKQGGNAIDAAVAAAFALGVAEPYNSGLGGGGFMLIYHAASKKVIALDYRETAPLQATEETFKQGSSVVGYKAIAVPGLVHGLETALKKYGSLPLKKTIEPAYKLAHEGFPVSEELRKRLYARGNCLGRFPATRKIFFHKSQPRKPGTNLVQSDLAKTLQLIGEQGSDVFYKGAITEKIAQAMKKNKGLIQTQDLNNYATRQLDPVVINHQGHAIHTMPLPSSGGLLMAQMFQILKGTPLKEWGWGSPLEAQRLVDAMKIAFAYRQKLGDTPPESPQTTHASFADHQGNVVAMTNSLNLSFGSCVTIPGTGILMNDHMDDFATRASQPNAFKLIQGEANKVAGGKRPLSSMSPTIVLKNGKPLYALGSPGGPTIISNVFQTLINLIDHNMGLERAVAAPKLHHQFKPDRLSHQKGYPAPSLEALRKQGYALHYRPQWGNLQVIRIDPKSGQISGVSDPRGQGKVISLDRLDAATPSH